MPHSPDDRLQDEQFRASELVQGSVLSAPHEKGLEELVLQVKRSAGCSQGTLGGGGVGARNQRSKDEPPTLIVFTREMCPPMAVIHFSGIQVGCSILTSNSSHSTNSTFLLF